MSNFHPPHPEDALLLRYSDGELQGLEARRIQKHLKECWRCRTQLEDLQSTVTEFMRYRDRMIACALPPPPSPWQDLRGDMDRLERTLPAPGARGWTFRALDWLPLNFIPSLAGRLAAAAALVVAVGWGSYWVVTRPAPAPVAPGGTQAAATMVPPVSVPKTLPPSAPRQKTEARPAPAGSVELKVWVALHRLQADLGEPIEVAAQPDGRVLVTGTAIPRARRSQLQAALDAIPGVAVKWEEAKPGQGPAREGVAFELGRLPWQADLEKVFGSAEMVERVSNEALDLSESLGARGHALRRLERLRTNALTAEETAEWNRLAGDHRREMRRLAGQLRGRLAPLWAYWSASAAAGMPPTNAAAAAAATRADHLGNVLFAGVASAAAPQATAQELLSLLVQLAAE
jgi:hypothetical protein